MKLQKSISFYLLIVLFLLSLVLFKQLVWNEYVVNLTESAALEEQGEKGTIIGISNNKSLAIVTLEDGFRVYAISEGYFGWTITDEVYISSKIEDKPFNAKQTTLVFKDDTKLSLVLATTNNSEVTEMVAFQNNNTEIKLGKVPNHLTNLYYGYSEEPYSQEIIFEAYSVEGNLLYRE